MSKPSNTLRRHRRFRLDIGNDAGTQRLKDMSMGGIRVQSQKALRLDESIEINLATPEGPVSVNGTVVRARRTGLEKLPYEYGFIFGDLLPEVAKKVKAFLEARGHEVEESTEFEPVQIELLRDRISELERELTKVRAEISGSADGDNGDAARESGAGSGVGSVKAVAPTHFDRDRFKRLIEAGQPLMLLVSRPGSYLSGNINRAVAGALTETFDFEMVVRKLKGSSSREALAGSLFAYYERDLIDFA